MEETKLDIRLIKEVPESELDSETRERAIYIESDWNSYVYQMTLSGKYNCEFIFISDFTPKNDDTLLLDNTLLFICTFNNIVVIDLEKGEIKQVLNFEIWQIFGIYKFKSGYIVRAEGANVFLDGNLVVKWEEWGADIFVNPLVENEFEIFDDYFTAIDWCGYMHYYNESGNFKTEYHDELNCDINLHPQNSG